MSKYARPLAGLAMVVALVGIVVVAAGMFRGSFADTVPLTVLSQRAGLVMNPDAKVKLVGVPVGTSCRSKTVPMVRPPSCWPSIRLN